MRRLPLCAASSHRPQKRSALVQVRGLRIHVGDPARPLQALPQIDIGYWECTPGSGRRSRHELRASGTGRSCKLVNDFADSSISLSKWFVAIWLMSSAKNAGRADYSARGLMPSVREHVDREKLGCG